MPECIKHPCGISFEGIDTCVIAEFHKEWKRPKKIEDIEETAFFKAKDEAIYEIVKLLHQKGIIEDGEEMGMIFSEETMYGFNIDFLLHSRRNPEITGGTAIVKADVETKNKRIDWFNPETDSYERIMWRSEIYRLKSICVFLEA